MLEIRTEHRGKTTVLNCEGRIDIGEALARLREAVICELGVPTIVLNLAQVAAIDAAGLGLLLFLHTRASARGCELKLCAPSPQVENVLALTRLDSVMAVCSAAELERSLSSAGDLSAHHTHEPYGAACMLCCQD